MTRPARPARQPSQRQLRAGEVIRHAIVEILAREDLREPALEGVSVTVSEVRTSPDLRNATVYCAALGGGLADGDANTAVAAALNRARGAVRKQLAARLDMKFTPSLTFVADESVTAARRVDAILARPDVRRDLTNED